jgi:acetyltransferase-like isoleucine patch superfamily enzyme
MLRDLVDSLVEARARFALRRCASVGEEPCVEGRVWIHGRGTIVVGDRVVFAARSAPIELNAYPGATIRIGDDSIIGGGTSIEATAEVSIGARCRIGPFCRIIDNDFHRMRGETFEDRQRWQPGTPIVVEDDVELGPRAILLPGTSVGQASLVGASSVVRRRIPPGSIARGNPAMSRARPPGGSPKP